MFRFISTEVHRPPGYTGRLKRMLLLVALLLAAGSADAAEKGGADWTRDELEAACLASLDVCVAACDRKNTVSGVIQEGFCSSDCELSYARCDASIPFKKRLNEQRKGNDKGTLLRH